MQFGDVELEIDGPPGDKYFLEFKAHGRFSDDLTEFLKHTVKADWCCLDIGANIGLTSLYMAAVAPSVEVLAFEPAPSAIGYLRANAERNVAKLRGSRVNPVQLALGDRKGTAQFVDLPEFSAGSHVLETAKLHPYAVGKTPVTVECMTLDEFVEAQQLHRVDLIKIDVEGFEEKVLNGARSTIARFAPLCVFEFNGWFLRELQNDARAQLLDALMAAFPQLYLVDRGSARLTPIANTREGRAAFIRQNEQSIVDNVLGVPRGRSHP